ncbi:NAD(P)-binding domain-containing protein [Nostoc sp.]|uniref:NAD(P)-binding domain-containing protein n=1 Tax=Nostoc sp. TaxID=1180 RepID=UPI002FF66A8C
MLGDLKIAFIGGGTMGEMIISRLLSTKIVEKPELIIVSDPVSTRCLHLERECDSLLSESRCKSVHN